MDDLDCGCWPGNRSTLCEPLCDLCVSVVMIVSSPQRHKGLTETRLLPTSSGSGAESVQLKARRLHRPLSRQLSPPQTFDIRGLPVPKAHRCELSPQT